MEQAHNIKHEENYICKTIFESCVIYEFEVWVIDKGIEDTDKDKDIFQR